MLCRISILFMAYQCLGRKCGNPADIESDQLLEAYPAPGGEPGSHREQDFITGIRLVDLTQEGG